VGHAKILRLQYIISDMSEWIRVARASELVGEGLGIAVKAEGLGLALFRWEDQVYAVEDLCPHMGFPLSEGIVQEGEVICMWHGWHIRLDDGSCRRQKAAAKVFPCEIRGDEVWVLLEPVPVSPLT
jgi:nitrite reductase/ring-hydroxylating ferredoxin subunit